MFNSVTLVGRLGKDPEIKRFSETSAIAEFPLATTDRYKDKDGKWIEVTDWHNIKFPFKSQADNAEKFIHKGSKILVNGKLKTRSFDDKDGNRRYTTEVVVAEWKMMDDRTESEPAQAPAPKKEEPKTKPSAAEIDDLPF